MVDAAAGRVTAAAVRAQVRHTLERPDERGRWAVKACMQAAQRGGLGLVWATRFCNCLARTLPHQSIVCRQGRHCERAARTHTHSTT